MGIRKLFDQKKITYSFEVFPPKTDSSVDTVYKALQEMKELSPDYISVTFGAGGSDGGLSTADLSSFIKDTLGILPIAHITCINSSREDILKILNALKKKGVCDILALRGDRKPDVEPKTDFSYARDLVGFLKENAPEFDVAVAGYPEGHPESGGLENDVEYLKQKVDRGADSIITQLFFDNHYFYDFMNRLRKKGITVPVQAGIMPVINKKQIERVVSLCGATYPPKFKTIADKYENNPAALFDAGIAYATEQITELIASGVDGIHLYTMNNPNVARNITRNIRSLLDFENQA